MIRRAALACVIVAAASGTASAFECTHYLEAIDIGLDLAKTSTDSFWNAMSPAARREVRRLRDQGEAACTAEDREVAAPGVGRGGEAVGPAARVRRGRRPRTGAIAADVPGQSSQKQSRGSAA